jgi:hypothetical protein
MVTFNASDVMTSTCKFTLGASLLIVVSCANSAEPDGSERWAADLTASRQVLFMTLQRSGSAVSGTGTLASLTNPGGAALTVTGTRHADSLSVSYHRPPGDAFRFDGRYTGQGLVGVLDGAEFVRVAVSFRSR